MIDDLATWLREQVDRDELTATDLDELGGWERSGIEATAGGHVVDYLDAFDSRRMLDEVDAKRRRLNLLEELAPRDPETALRLAKLDALPYADRPSYRDEWRPE